jgi:ACS family hexuronate transporter-like MFS transporter
MLKRAVLPNMRWIIAGLLLLSTMINYTDRLTLSVLVGDVRRDLGLSETDYSQILSVFLFSYAVMYAGSGYIVDRLGTRRGFSLFVFTWSLSQMLHGLAIGKWSLAGCRFMLGLTEPGNFPAAVKAIREWFPPEQRAIGVGIFNAGSSLGSAIAAPLAAFIALRWGWCGWRSGWRSTRRRKSSPGWPARRRNRRSGRVGGRSSSPASASP